MKTKHFKVTLNVEIDPQGESTPDLIMQMQRVVSNAVNNGLLTGNTAATVEQYSSSVKEIRKRKKSIRRKSGEHLFSNPTDGIPRCITCGCDEDDAFVGGQECSYGEK